MNYLRPPNAIIVMQIPETDFVVAESGSVSNGGGASGEGEMFALSGDYGRRNT